MHMIHAMVVGLITIVCFWFVWGTMMVALTAIFSFASKYKALTTIILMILAGVCFGPTALIIRLIMTTVIFGGTAYWLAKYFNNP